MTPKTKFFDRIDDYCQDQLSQDHKLEFEKELAQNDALSKELKLQGDIRKSILEKDIISLRGKLAKVAIQVPGKNISNDSFDLLTDFSDFEEINETLTPEELINFYDSLPKVHAYQHGVSNRENIYHFYKTQEEAANLVSNKDFDEDVNFVDDFDLEGLEEAILEKDILEFRQTLRQVAKTVEPQFSIEQIDAYLNGELSKKALAEFEKDLSMNRSLKEEVQLLSEVNTATGELDIINLRKKLSAIVQAETSWRVSEKSIEDFVDGVLEGSELEEFRLELRNNKDLLAEVNLRKQINELLAESDILDLKKELHAAKKRTQSKKIRMLLPETKLEQPRFWRNSVAIVILLLGIAGVLGNGMVSVDSLYESYYKAPSWSPERSVSSGMSYLQQANLAYVSEDFNQVVNVFESAPEDVVKSPVFQFYQAASLQSLGKYKEAIPGYNQIIANGDNLFIEEAEWYRSLCYLKTGDKWVARQQLLAVINRKGYFADDAKAILRRLRYSLK